MFLLCLGNAINDGSKEGKLKKLFLARFEVTKYTRFCFRHYMTKHREGASTVHIFKYENPKAEENIKYLDVPKPIFVKYNIAPC